MKVVVDKDIYLSIYYYTNIFSLLYHIKIS